MGHLGRMRRGSTSTSSRIAASGSEESARASHRERGEAEEAHPEEKEERGRRRHSLSNPWQPQLDRFMPNIQHNSQHTSTKFPLFILLLYLLLELPQFAQFPRSVTPEHQIQHSQSQKCKEEIQQPRWRLVEIIVVDSRFSNP